MTNYRFGLQKLPEKANVSVKLKSKFGLTPEKEEIKIVEPTIKPYQSIYAGTNSAPAYLINFSLDTFQETGTITTAYNYIDTVLYDNKKGYLYFATWQNNPAILKVRASDFSIVDTIILDGLKYITNGVIDVEAGFAYFSSGVDILKLDLNTFSIIDIITITLTYNVYESFGIIDLDAGYLYFSRYYDFAIIKVRLSDFTHVDTLFLVSSNFKPYAGVIDIKAGYAYFGGDDSIDAQIRRIRLSDFSSDGILTLGGVADYKLYTGAVLDLTATFAYFGTNTDPGKLLKIRLSDFSLIDTLSLETGETGLESIAIDENRGFLYCITYKSPGSAQSSIIKIRLSDFTRVDSTVFSVGTWGIFDSVIV